MCGPNATELRISPETPREQLAHAGRLFYQRGLLEMYEGRFPEAAASFQTSLDLGQSAENARRTCVPS